MHICASAGHADGRADQCLLLLVYKRTRVLGVANRSRSLMTMAFERVTYACVERVEPLGKKGVRC